MILCQHNNQARHPVLSALLAPFLSSLLSNPLSLFAAAPFSNPLSLLAATLFSSLLTAFLTIQYQIINRLAHFDLLPFLPMTVHCPGAEPFTARPLRIREYCDPKEPLPASMQEAGPETSRFLDALEKQYRESKQRRADAISFGGYRKKVEPDV